MKIDIKIVIIICLLTLLGVCVWYSVVEKLGDENQIDFLKYEVASSNKDAYNEAAQVDCLSKIWFLWITDKAPNLNSSQYADIFSHQIKLVYTDYASKSSLLKDSYLGGKTAEFADYADNKIDCGFK